MTARHRRITDPGQGDALKTWWRIHNGVSVGYHGFKSGGRRYWKRWTNRRERRAAQADAREFRALARKTVADNIDILRALE